jgi:hypothetical protein
MAHSIYYNNRIFKLTHTTTTTKKDLTNLIKSKSKEKGILILRMIIFNKSVATAKDERGLTLNWSRLKS